MPHWHEDRPRPDWLERFLSAETDGRHLSPESWSELEARFGPQFPREVLYLLTRKDFGTGPARRYWREALEHRQAMSQTLGRDVGLRAALADYLINIRPQMRQPLLVEDWLLAQKEQNAICDELTGLFNRRFFNSVLAKQVASSLRYRQGFSLLMLDVDRFKQVNDRLGHLAGDRVLAGIARLLQISARDIDYLVRYGGEEFAVILPLAGKEQALAVAQRHRRAIAEHRFPGVDSSPEIRLTVSIGVASFPEDARDALGLIAKADMALYQAKRQGRDQVVGAEPERRRHRRIPLVATVSLRPLREGLAPLTAQTVDVSVSGLGLVASTPLEPGHPLEVVLDLPQNQVRILVRGQVVRVETGPSPEDGYQLGVALTDPDRHPDYRHLVEGALGRPH